MMHIRLEFNNKPAQQIWITTQWPRAEFSLLLQENNKSTACPAIYNVLPTAYIFIRFRIDRVVDSDLTCSKVLFLCFMGFFYGRSNACGPTSWASSSLAGSSWRRGVWTSSFASPATPGASPSAPSLSSASRVASYSWRTSCYPSY